MREGPAEGAGAGGDRCADRALYTAPALPDHGRMDTPSQRTPVPGPATPPAPAPVPGRRFDWLHMVLLALVAIMLTAGVAYWVFKAYLFPSEFTPVTLSGREERALEAKLERLESLEPGRTRTAPALPAGPLEPEAYSEEGASREVTFTEKELNALLAKNTDLARKLAIDLGDDLVSAKLLVPLEPDFPVLGGQILKVRAGVEMAYRDGKPVVVLKGVSLMGVPLPNAWIGGLKNIDLVREFGTERGFWQAFADGVEDIHVEDGRLKIKLKE